MRGIARTPAAGSRDDQSAPGTSAGTDARSAEVRRLARVLDTAFRVPGTQFRFGVDPLLGILPGIGDVLGGFFSGYILFVGIRAGAPKSVLMRMFFNVATDTLFGAIPLFGDLLDAGWKANTRNVHLLERYLEDPGQTASASRAFIFFLVLALVLLIAATVVITALVVRWVFGLLGG